jgi:hypothetical protein
LALLTVIAIHFNLYALKLAFSPKRQSLKVSNLNLQSCR